VAKAKAFGADPELKKVMEEAGVSSEPEFYLMETIESKMKMPG
jgi:hypothetical protein